MRPSFLLSEAFLFFKALIYAKDFRCQSCVFLVMVFIPVCVLGILKETEQFPSGLDDCQLHRLPVIDDNIIFIPTGRSVKSYGRAQQAIWTSRVGEPHYIKETYIRLT